MSFELVLNKEERFFVVWCYFASSDKEGKAQKLVEKALRERPEGTMPLVIGDINANLDAPRSPGEEELAQMLGDHGLGCASCHFRVRRRWHVRGRWIWRREKGEATRLGNRRWIRSRPDHFLVREEERKRIKRC